MTRLARKHAADKRSSLFWSRIYVSEKIFFLIFVENSGILKNLGNKSINLTYPNLTCINLTLPNQTNPTQPNPTQPNPTQLNPY
jgi:hypothetical protein